MEDLGFYLSLAGIAIGFYLIGRQRHKKSVERDMRELRWFKKNILQHQGATKMVPGTEWYDLRSHDGGKNWVALSKDGSVLGEAEKVHPGLLKHIEGMNQLFDHVQRHGPISAPDSEGIQALRNAGFTVKVGAP